MTQNLAARWWWEVARRGEVRVARRLSRKPVVAGVYRLEEGAMLAEFFHVLPTLGVMALLAQLHGAAMPRVMVPCSQDCLALRAEDRVWDCAHAGAARAVVQC